MVSRMRVYELAGELGLASSEGVLAMLRLLGEQVRSASSLIDESAAQRLRERIQGERDRLRSQPISAHLLALILSCPFQRMHEILRTQGIAQGYTPSMLIDETLQYRVREQIQREREQLLSEPVRLDELARWFISTRTLIAGIIRRELGDQQGYSALKNPELLIDASIAQKAAQHIQRRAENAQIISILKTVLQKDTPVATATTSAATVSKGFTPTTLSGRRPRRICFADEPPPGFDKLTEIWSKLQKLAPRAQGVDYLTRVSGLPRHQVDHLRRVRNACAHPAERGWPSPEDIRIALATASDIWASLEPRSL